MVLALSFCSSFSFKFVFTQWDLLLILFLNSSTSCLGHGVLVCNTNTIDVKPSGKNYKEDNESDNHDSCNSLTLFILRRRDSQNSWGVSVDGLDLTEVTVVLISLAFWVIAELKCLLEVSEMFWVHWEHLGNDIPVDQCTAGWGCQRS